jgi:hypothetical protein
VWGSWLRCDLWLMHAVLAHASTLVDEVVVGKRKKTRGKSKKQKAKKRNKKMVNAPGGGLNPRLSAHKTDALPLNYGRIAVHSFFLTLRPKYLCVKVRRLEPTVILFTF